MNEKQIVHPEDRRRYFRIDDEVNLFYSKVNENYDLDSSLLSNDLLGAYSLTAAMGSLSQEADLILRRLENSSPEIAEYLRVMDNKIDLITRSIVMQGADIYKNNARNVNLSAAGLAVDCEEELAEGQNLEIKMLLTSCMAVIVTIGKVVNCRKNTEDENSHYPYYVGVDYVEMKDQDRELLIKHVVKKQMQQIRDKRVENSSVS